MTVVVAVAENVSVAKPATNPSLSPVLTLDVKPDAGVAVPQAPTFGVQVKVTVPVRKLPKLPPEDKALALAVSTMAESATFVPEPTVILEAGAMPEAPANTDVVVGAATMVKATAVGATLVPLAQAPAPGLGQ